MKSTLKPGSNFGRKGPRWHISNVIRSADVFGRNVPTFNIKGDENVRTFFGGAFTVGLMVLATVYALVKLQDLVTGDNPNIAELTFKEHYPPDHRLVL